MSIFKTSLFILLYYTVCFFCLFFATTNMGYAALLVSIIISLIQVPFFITKETLIPFLIWLISFSFCGYLVDSLFLTYGIISFASNPWGNYFAPPWILALWINFSVLCFGVRGFLERNIKYIPLFGLCGFPLAYSAGMKFGVANLYTPW